MAAKESIDSARAMLDEVSCVLVTAVADRYVNSMVQFLSRIFTHGPAESATVGTRLESLLSHGCVPTYGVLINADTVSALDSIRATLLTHVPAFTAGLSLLAQSPPTSITDTGLKTFMASIVDLKCPFRDWTLPVNTSTDSRDAVNALATMWDNAVGACVTHIVDMCVVQMARAALPSFSERYARLVKSNITLWSTEMEASRRPCTASFQCVHSHPRSNRTLCISHLSTIHYSCHSIRLRYTYSTKPVTKLYSKGKLVV